MFPTPPRFIGLRSRSPWLRAFRRATRLPERLTLGDVDVALSSSLTQWWMGSGLLAADAGYSAAERYCIRMAFLLRIYRAFAARGFAEQVAATIAERALDVLEETPVGSQPTAAAGLRLAPFPEAVLAHVEAVYDYYRNHEPAIEGFPPRVLAAEPVTLPLTSPGFLCTVVLPADMDVALGRSLWRQFMRENTCVRLLTLGADAGVREIVETADAIFFSPGGGQRPGRCLWVQPVALEPDIHQWLLQQGCDAPTQVRCIVLSVRGALSTVLRKTDTIDDFALSEAFFNAG